MAKKPSIPKGTRDFSPAELIKRNYIFDTVKKHFQLFGFQPIETPSFENSETLLGKYGEEGDRLIFKILESGDYMSKADDEMVEKSISIYLAISYIYKDVFYFFINKIKELDQESLPSEGFNRISESDDLKDFYEYKLNEWSSFLLDHGNLINCFREEARQIRNQIINVVRKRIELKGFDFQTKIDDFKNQEWELKWADRHPVKNIASTVWNNINNKENQKLRLELSSKIAGDISEKALRYDLTVPFARYVVMHQNELDFPFKRYQIQPVWRADRPQKGRFREFYQCDADVVGANSLLQEVELIQLYDSVFTDLQLHGVTLKVNHRKILSGIAEVIGAKHVLTDFTVALDKLDKIGEEGVKKEMLEKGIHENAIALTAPLFSLSGSNTDQLDTLAALLKDSEEGSKGIAELREILQTVEVLGLRSSTLAIDVTLARGLNYYTGTIFEVAPPKGVAMGSIGGGGRYDDLTGIFGLKEVSGVGISFGLDRIYLVLEELGLFPKALQRSLDVLCVNFGGQEALEALKLVGKLRSTGIKADLYPIAAKMQKQFKYANNRKVPYVISIGAQELADNSFVVKNMVNGEQQTYPLDNPQAFLETL
ncbi:histidine--tRNA ligase [Flavobacteriaceae bacterium 3-367]